MKKTFIAPVAAFTAIETENNILSTSSVSIDTTKQNNETAGARQQNNSTTNASNPINVEALDF